MKSTTSTRMMANAVINYIEANPDKHSQAYFILNPDDNGCGTTMCIAGTANWLIHGREAKEYQSVDVGRTMLGLSLGEAEVLFYDMSNARALAKLRKVAAGVPFTRDDFYKSNDDGDTPYFCDWSWERKDEYL